MTAHLQPKYTQQAMKMTTMIKLFAQQPASEIGKNTEAKFASIERAILRIASEIADQGFSVNPNDITISIKGRSGEISFSIGYSGENSVARDNFVRKLRSELGNVAKLVTISEPTYEPVLEPVMA